MPGARNRSSGGDQERTLLSDGQKAIGTLLQNPEELIDLGNALESLRPEQVRMIELRYFAGLTMEETAAIMHIRDHAHRGGNAKKALACHQTPAV
jgi:DNA-directed RNA polymerase specialized sigma24 family protein